LDDISRFGAGLQFVEQIRGLLCVGNLRFKSRDTRILGSQLVGSVNIDKALVACIDGIADKQIQVNAEEVAAFVLPDCPAEFAAPEGKQFKGWALTNGGEVLSEVTLDADKTLYAVWEAIPVTYTVTFDPNGAAGTMEPAKAQGTFTLPACAFTAPEAKQFQGWSLAVNG
jgi:hypothetical protein